MRLFPIFALTLLATPTVASATETVTYSYDAKGRLTGVQHSGGPANGTTTAYSYDPADNRSNVTLTGAPGHIVVVPLNGLTVIALPAS